MEPIKVTELPGIKAYPVNDVNPFTDITDFQKKILSPLKHVKTAVVKTSTGNIVQAHERTVSTNTFTKMYHTNLRVFHNLTKNASLLFMYMGLKLQKNQDHILLHVDEVCKEFDISPRTYNSAISCLLYNKMIGRTKLHCQFFINTNYMFNGTDDARRTLTTVSIIKEDPNMKDLPQPTKLIEPNETF